MLISIRANQTSGSTIGNAGSSSITVPVPSGLVAGDIICIYVVCFSTSVITSTGFTSVASASETTLESIGTLLTKIATGTESGTFTISLGGAYQSGSAICFSVAGASFIFGNSGATGTEAYSSSVALTGPSVATGGTNNFVLWLGGSVSAAPGTPLSSTTLPINFSSPNGTVSGTLNNGVVASLVAAGFTDPLSHTISNSGQFTYSGTTDYSGLVVQLILIPALPIKMYADGKFQASQFIESSAAGPAMKMYSNNTVQVKTMVESYTGTPPSIGANTYTISNNSTTATTPPVTTQTGGSTFLAYMYTSSFVSMTDSFGNNYVSKGTFGPDGNGKYNIIYECVNGIGGANHTVTFTNSNAGNRTLFFIEILNSGGYDSFGYSIGNTTVSPVTFSFTTQTFSSNELALLFAGDYTSATYTANFTVGNSFNFLLTQNNSVTYQSGFIADFVTSNTSPISVTWSDSGVSTTSGSVTSVSTILTYNPIFPPVQKLYANGTFVVSSQFIE